MLFYRWLLMPKNHTWLRFDSQGAMERRQGYHKVGCGGGTNIMNFAKGPSLPRQRAGVVWSLTPHSTSALF